MKTKSYKAQLWLISFLLMFIACGSCKAEDIEYTTLGLSYTLAEHWHHIQIDNQNDIFAIDKNNIKNNAIYIQVQDLSEYALMMNTKENTERMLNSIVDSAMQTMNMTKTIVDYPINDFNKIGILKMGVTDYGVVTMYMEIINEKLFSLSLITESNPEMYVDEIIDCIFSITGTNKTNSISNHKNLENNGVLVQHEQKKLLYSVWDDWITINDTEDTYTGTTIRQFCKTKGKPSDGMLVVLTNEKILDDSDNYKENFQTLLDICIDAFKLNDVDIESKYFITESLVLGYRALTVEDLPMNYGIFVSYEGNFGYCFLMISSNERQTNTEWLETVINTIYIKQ